jgi:hypothetical protein
MNNCKIKTWKQFASKVRSMGCHLLYRLDEFPGSILVTGCQRSGTTMLTRIINQSDLMVDYTFGKDDELDAALILSGKVKHAPIGRYCFQTTFLNECYLEYLDHDIDNTIIWVIRNPFSVVYSLVFNWERWALNELFHACGTKFLDNKMQLRLEKFGVIGVPKIIRGCLAYNGKLEQAFYLKKRLKRTRFFIVDYDALVTKKDAYLPMIFDYLKIPYNPQIATVIHQTSLDKRKKLSKKNNQIIESICSPVYKKAQVICDLV